MLLYYSSIRSLYIYMQTFKWFWERFPHLLRQLRFEGISLSRLYRFLENTQVCSHFYPRFWLGLRVVLLEKLRSCSWELVELDPCDDVQIFGSMVRISNHKSFWKQKLNTKYKTTPCGPAPPSTEKPAMAYTSSKNWQKYDVIVLLCKQDCTPSQDYISFIFGLRQHSLLNLHLIKISINFLCLLLLVWG